MSFKPKETKKKKKSVYKSMYIAEDLVEQINKIAKENHTSFNNTVVSMIEYCLEIE